MALSQATAAWEWDKSGYWNDRQRTLCSGGGQTLIKYETVTGFFLQDQPDTDSKKFDYAKNNFGLMNRTYETDARFDPSGVKTQWQRFAYYVNTLNQEADPRTQYKVLFMGRHGEGYHNAAESYYGTPAWNCYYAELDGNGTVTWADARVTEAGAAEAVKAHNFWASQLAAQGQPAIQSYYTSPLTRCLQTANLTFSGLDLPAESPFVPTVKEFLREDISIHTCDRRSSKTYIQTSFPTFKIEAGFTELDELWRGTEGEPEAAQAIRSKALLDDIFSHDDNTWLSFTSHSGQIRSILSVLGHRSFSLSTGQVIPVLVKAQNFRNETATTTSVAWEAEATCHSPPVTSLSNGGCVCSSTTVATNTATATP
ncbi:uncharacterized protein E0L32_002824 [Thyridium curvatum]|uniref:Phosphoglycerate mutase n=1 Tax=Thyridium curvatum TaxID=1093900 RepID=A0A507BE14_9PEZI|nr:uncharacterized protein E0L32_002824 [Thyridium curvatum]TPX17723.1 hypothetical protein E0L32_002824 [Thyridium curvatum]